MKTSIPSDVWEKKKALIARLYKDEEWPLKQVIKQIRTTDFNPSRLKKWRVTKPSRQVRKKPAGEQGDNDEEEEEEASEETSPVETKTNNHQTMSMNQTTPTITPPAAAVAMLTPQSQPDLALTREWYPTDVWVQSQHDELIIQPVQNVVATQAETQSWTASVSAPSPINTAPEQHQSHAVSQINTPIVTQFPSHHSLTAYDFSQQQQQQQQQLPSPQNSISPNNIPPNTHVLSPTFISPTFAMAPISYPQPAPPTATHWPDYIEPDTTPSTLAMQPTNWYATMYDVGKVTAPPPGDAASAYYQRMNSGAYNQVMQHMASASPDMYQAQAQSQLQPQPQLQSKQQQQQPIPTNYQGYDNVPVRPWRRAMTSHHSNNPESTPLVRVDRQGRQRKPVADRKRKESNEEMEIIAQQQHIQSIQQQQQQQQQQQLSIMHPVYQQHPQYIATGHHPQSLMPHENMLYAYAGHEQTLLPRPMGH
ncbi:hypothetical protein UA08_06238 [Talaromyces atroroseus]|uniref:Clr5 domain-containing protein n=1 Tax=Talaromyces atroroseus TaxID=1441469 RepID=A0A225AE26_TALAT|nr:hypothetical protein UA08_06238 [Talaromyces atroroseus]OKL58750.1 hypothetical protein UA08_06238 [Talaromyces atroroseus]